VVVGYLITVLPQKGETMAFTFTNSKGTTYYLHAKTVERKGGTKGQLFFFSKELKPADALPEAF
jgi:hypothetical protein